MRQALWPLSRGRLGELASPHAAGQLSAVLFILCGLLVAVTSPLMPAAPDVHRLALVAVGLIAAAAGVVIMALPWARWPRHATLWLVPLAFACTAAHNFASGDDGLRYTVFFFVVAAWIGLMHPAGTTLASTPAMVGAYLLPPVVLGGLADVATSLTYAVPVYLLIGECASLVAEKVRRSENELRASEERFRALVQHSADGISVVDEAARIRWDSPGITAVLGYVDDERVGADGMDYVHPDQVALAQSVLGELMSSPGSTRGLEVQVRHRDGHWLWCDVTVQNLLHEPAVGGLVVNISDVTARHQAQEIQQQLAAIVESSSDAILGQSLDGRILSWNSAAEQMYSWPAAEAVG
jgi:PAS domain S-box-containing protein